MVGSMNATTRTVTESDAALLQAVLEIDIDIAKRRDARGLTPLHRLALSGTGSKVIPCVDLLLQAHPMGAADQGPEGLLPLHLCLITCNTSMLKMVRRLLGANMHAAKEASTSGVLPLHVAAFYLDCDAASMTCIQLLLVAYPEAAAQADSEGCLPLHLLAENPKGASPFVINALATAYSKGLMCKNKSGLTPLQVAKHCGYMSTAALRALQKLTDGKRPGKTYDRKNGKHWGRRLCLLPLEAGSVTAHLIYHVLTASLFATMTNATFFRAT